MEQGTKEEYKEILTEIIKKQALILGPNMAVLKARGVEGLAVTDDGTVTDIQSGEQETLQKLIDAYVSLSGDIVRNAVNSVFAKYPSISRRQH